MTLSLLKIVRPILMSCIALSCAVAPLAISQDLEPRSFTNVPIGQTFAVLGYLRSEGELSPTPGALITDAELTIEAAVIGVAHTFALAGSSAKIDFGATRICTEGSATFQGEFIEGRRCGYGDAKMRISWNFYGAPALELKEYSQWEPGLVVGTSLQLSIPSGTYDSDRLLNAGANRWMVRPGIGLSYKTGRWLYDLIASVRFYEDNDKFFNGIHVEQDPLYSMQGHLLYTFGRGSWISLNVNFYRGGETSKDGIKSDDLQENSRFGVTYSTPLTAHLNLKLYANTGVVTRIGSDFETAGIALQYRF